MNVKAIATQMKVTCRPSVLSQALQVVSRAISSRTTLPILNNILIETTPEGLALTATNLEIGIRKVVPAEVLMEGSTTAPARLLTDFVSTLPDQDLELSLDGASQSLGLRCARFDTHIKCIEAEEFPPGPRPDEGDRLEVPLDELVKAVEQTQMAASTDEARPVLTGVLVQVQGLPFRPNLGQPKEALANLAKAETILDKLKQREPKNPRLWMITVLVVGSSLVRTSTTGNVQRAISTAC